MNVDGMRGQAQMNAMLYHDNSALAKIKHSSDQQGALNEVAGQFEAMFLQLVLRQMRSSSDVLADEDSPFSSQQYGVFRDMHDGQLAIEMAGKQNAGIAGMLVKQLGSSVAAANDGQVAKNTEVRSRDHTLQDLNHRGTVNQSAHVVASQEKQRNDVITSTAFSQPLIRKMEQ